MTPWRAAFWNGLRESQGFLATRGLPGYHLSPQASSDCADLGQETWVQVFHFYNTEILLLTPQGDWVRRKSPVNGDAQEMLTLSFFPTFHLTHTFCLKSHGPSVKYLPVALQVHFLPIPTLLLPLQTDLYGSHPQAPMCVQGRVPERGQRWKQSWGWRVARGKGEVSDLNILLLPAVLLNQRPPLFSRRPLLNDKPFWLLKTTPSTSPIAAGVLISPSEFLPCPWRFPLCPIHNTLSEPS